MLGICGGILEFYLTTIVQSKEVSLINKQIPHMGVQIQFAATVSFLAFFPTFWDLRKNLHLQIYCSVVFTTAQK